MMTTAVLVHHLPGRTRFRVLDKRDDDVYHDRVKDELTQCPGVRSVSINRVTGSVLVFHDAVDPDVLIAYARSMDLFDLPAPPLASGERSPATIVTSSIERLDRWVRAESRSATDLRALAMTGLLSAGVWQLLRGRVLPPALTLLVYALGVASADKRESTAVHADSTESAHK